VKRKKIVAGNWKMNTSYEEAQKLVKDILACAQKGSDVTKIVFPPFTFINNISEILKDTQGFFVGAQNCSEHQKGAYTGEISAEMAKSVGCSHVLIGHSERRTYFDEQDQQLGGKIDRVLENGLVPVFCIGEQLEDRKMLKYFEKVRMQLTEVLKHFAVEKMDNLILAYEPVWAIGTGETASPVQAQEMHAFIRASMGQLFNEEFAARLPILYGGSCNAQNAAELFASPDVDGGLIGGASLKAADFCKIISSF
jgi:triosephosphate isomerase (TIM)